MIPSGPDHRRTAGVPVWHHTRPLFKLVPSALLPSALTGNMIRNAVYEYLCCCFAARQLPTTQAGNYRELPEITGIMKISGHLEGSRREDEVGSLPPRAVELKCDSPVGRHRRVENPRTIRYNRICRRSVAQSGQSAGLQNQWSRVRILPLLPYIVKRSLKSVGPGSVRGLSLFIHISQSAPI